MKFRLESRSTIRDSHGPRIQTNTNKFDIIHNQMNIMVHKIEAPTNASLGFEAKEGEVVVRRSAEEVRGIFLVVLGLENSIYE